MNFEKFINSFQLEDASLKESQLRMIYGGVGEKNRR